MESKNIQSGDHVKLSTNQGPVMTAEWQNNASEWICTYWDGDKNEFVKKKFKEQVLIKVQKSGS